MSDLKNTPIVNKGVEYYASEEPYVGDVCGVLAVLQNYLSADGDTLRIRYVKASEQLGSNTERDLDDLDYSKYEII